MSDKIEAVIKIQSLIRGSLYRKGINHKSRCMEFRLMNILPNRKPPVYRKKLRNRSKQGISEKKIVEIQRHIRGYLQRKRYKELLIEKMLKEQEELYRKRMEKIELELASQDDVSKSSNSIISKVGRSENLYLELPLPMSQKKSPSVSKNIRKNILFDYNYYILAAKEIQRIFRGYITRKKYGNFRVIRKKIIKIQRLYKN